MNLEDDELIKPELMRELKKIWDAINDLRASVNNLKTRVNDLESRSYGDGK